MPPITNAWSPFKNKLFRRIQNKSFSIKKHNLSELHINDSDDVLLLLYKDENAEVTQFMFSE